MRVKKIRFSIRALTRAYSILIYHLLVEPGSGSDLTGKTGSVSNPTGKTGSGSDLTGKTGSVSDHILKIRCGSYLTGKTGSGSDLAGKTGSGSYHISKIGSGSHLFQKNRIRIEPYFDLDPTSFQKLGRIRMRGF